MKDIVGKYGAKERDGWVVWDGVSPLPKKYNIVKGKPYHLYNINGVWTITDSNSIRIFDLRYFMYSEDYSFFKYGIKYDDVVVIKDEFKGLYPKISGERFTFLKMYYSPATINECFMGVFKNEYSEIEYSLHMSKLISFRKHRGLTIDEILK